MLRGMFVLVLWGAFAMGAMSAASAPSDAAKQTSASPVRTAPPSATRLPSGPLSAGGPAGIKQAQGRANPIWNWVPFGVVGGLGLLVVLTGGDDDDTVPVTTSN